MEIISNLKELQHLRLENMVLNSNNIPLIFNFLEDYYCEIMKTNVSELQVYVLRNMQRNGKQIVLEYSKEELPRSSDKKIEFMHQNRLL